MSRVWVKGKFRVPLLHPLKRNQVGRVLFSIFTQTGKMFVPAHVL
jgi:hypothetical protein